jgi:hypothetical protein
VSAAAITAATAAAWLSLLRGVGDLRGEGPAEPAQQRQAATHSKNTQTVLVGVLAHTHTHPPQDSQASPLHPQLNGLFFCSKSTPRTPTHSGTHLWALSLPAVLLPAASSRSQQQTQGHPDPPPQQTPQAQPCRHHAPTSAVPHTTPTHQKYHLSE